MLDEALTILVCGSASSMGLPAYLHYIRLKLDSPLRVMITLSAEGFVRPEAVAAYADECYIAHDRINPTEVAMRSRGLVVLPSTMNMLAAAAIGLAQSPAQTVAACYPGRILFFPAMHHSMWERTTTRRNVAELRKRDNVVIDPVAGESLELWQRKVVPSLVLPNPPDVADILHAWLETPQIRRNAHDSGGGVGDGS